MVKTEKVRVMGRLMMRVLIKCVLNCSLNKSVIPRILESLGLQVWGWQPWGGHVFWMTSV